MILTLESAASLTEIVQEVEVALEAELAQTPRVGALEVKKRTLMPRANAAIAIPASQ